MSQNHRLICLCLRPTFASERFTCHLCARVTLGPLYQDPQLFCRLLSLPPRPFFGRRPRSPSQPLSSSSSSDSFPLISSTVPALLLRRASGSPPLRPPSILSTSVLPLRRPFFVPACARPLKSPPTVFPDLDIVTLRHLSPPSLVVGNRSLPNRLSPSPFPRSVRRQTPDYGHLHEEEPSVVSPSPRVPFLFVRSNSYFSQGPYCRWSHSTFSLNCSV